MLAIALLLLLLAFCLSMFLDTATTTTNPRFDFLHHVTDLLVGSAGVCAALVLLGQLCPMILRSVIEYAIAHPWVGA